jgi:hypothetical protein
MVLIIRIPNLLNTRASPAKKKNDANNDDIPQARILIPDFFNDSYTLLNLLRCLEGK